MGKCLATLNCNDSGTNYFDSVGNGVEIEEMIFASNKYVIKRNQQSRHITSKRKYNIAKLAKYPQIVLSLGTMFTSSSTYTYMLTSNINFEDFIHNKLKGVVPNNQFLICVFMFDQVLNNLKKDK